MEGLSPAAPLPVLGRRISLTLCIYFSYKCVSPRQGRDLAARARYGSRLVCKALEIRRSGPGAERGWPVAGALSWEFGLGCCC